MPGGGWEGKKEPARILRSVPHREAASTRSRTSPGPGLGTGFSTSVGTADQAGKVFTYTREETDPVTKQKSKARDVIRIESNDKYVMEMYKDEGGKEIKMMEIVSTRKK